MTDTLRLELVPDAELRMRGQLGSDTELKTPGSESSDIENDVLHHRKFRREPSKRYAE